MIDKIIKPIKKELCAKLIVLGIEPEKSNLVINLAKTSITRKLQAYAAVTPLDSVKKLFSGAEPFEENKTVQPMLIDLKYNLVSRMNLREKEADRIARFIIPFILSQASNRINQHPEELKSLFSGGSIFGRLKMFAVAL